MIDTETRLQELQRQENVIYDSSSRYDSLVAMGIEARELKDASQWAIGDIGIELLNEAKDEKITKTEFAKDIGIGRSAFVEYIAMSQFYDTYMRSTYHLSYSHFRQAYRVNKKTLEKAMKLLEYANDNNLTVDGLAREIAIKSGKPECIKMSLEDMITKYGNIQMTVRESIDAIKAEAKKDQAD